MSKTNEKIKYVEVENKEIAKNFEHSIKMMRRLLQLIGMWPIASQTYPKVLRLLLIGIVSCLLMSFVVPFCLFMLVIVKDSQVCIIIEIRFSFPIQ